MEVPSAWLQHIYKNTFWVHPFTTDVFQKLQNTFDAVEFGKSFCHSVETFSGDAAHSHADTRTRHTGKMRSQNALMCVLAAVVRKNSPLQQWYYP